jgi:L-ribulose-5-phosphate 3-epimerase
MKLSNEIWPNNPYGEMGVTGVPINSWGDKPIEWCVDRSQEYGYSAVDFFYTRFLDFDKKEYERLSRELKGYVAEKNMEIASIGAHFLTLTSQSWRREEQIKATKKAIDFSADIGARTVVAYIGGYYVPQTYMLMSRKEAMQIMVDMVRECAEYAGERGLTFSIEPHQETLINLPDVTIEVIERVGLDNVRVTVDFGGMELGIRPHMEIEDAFKQFAPYLNHVHAKDITGVIGNWNMCWFGGGMVNFARYAKALDAIGYDGYVCVEWEGWFKGGPGGVGDMDMPGMADMDRAAIEAYEFLAPHFEKKKLA